MLNVRAIGIISLGLLFCCLLLFPCAPCSHAAGTCGGTPLTITGPDGQVNGSQYLVDGGTAPYSWCISKGSINSYGVVTVYGHCGTGTITVWDSCGNTAKKTVRMPDAQWIGVETYNPCPTCSSDCGNRGYANTCYVDSVANCNHFGVSGDCNSGYTSFQGATTKYIFFTRDCATGYKLWWETEWHTSTCPNSPIFTKNFSDIGANNCSYECVHYSNQGSPTYIKSVPTLLRYTKFEWRSPTCNEPEATCTRSFDFKIDYFKGPDDPEKKGVLISPVTGGNLTLTGKIIENYGKPINWKVTVAGRTYPGNGAEVNVNWDGKDGDGKVVEKGRPYSATLTAWNTCECNATSVPLKITVTDPPPNSCGLLVKFGSTANVASGNLAHSQELFSSKGGALPLGMTLYYNSLDPVNGALGWGWSYSYDISLSSSSDGAALLKEPNWQSRVYTLANDAYVSPPGDYSTLVRNGDGAFILTRKEGTRYNFGADGKITSIVDLNGNTVTFVYTGGNLASVTDPAGRQAIFAYDSNNHLISVTGPSGNAYTFSHNGPMLSSVLYPGGGVWDYTYDDKAFMLTKSDPLGEITTYAYDDNHRIVSSVDPEGKTRSIGYPQGAETIKNTTFTEQDGGVWTYVYDTRSGTLAQKVDPQGGVTSYIYDAGGNRTSVTDPAGATTGYAYDGQGNMTAMTDAAGQTTSYTYNTFGQVMTSTDLQGNSTSYTYDAKGNLTAMTDVAGATTGYEYDSRGNVTKVTNPLGQVTTYAYDNGGNLVSVIDPTGAATTSVYDASGNLKSQTDPLGKTATYTYDSNNRLLTTTYPLGNTTTYIYDESGNRISLTDANGNTTNYEYNSQGQLVKVTDPLGNVTTYAYGDSGCPSCGGGGVGKLSSLTDAKGQTTAWQYDKLGNMVRETDPLQHATIFNYDPAGNLAQKTDANGAAVAFSYDPLKRLTGKTYPDGSALSYSYDVAGRISTTANSEVSYSYTYDAAGRPISVTDSRGYVMAYEYDLLGNRTKMIFQPGKTDERVTTYGYDAGNRLQAITSPAGTFSYGYDTLGRRTSLGYPNQVTTSYSYDDAGRLTGLGHMAGSSSIAAFSYAVDNVGNRTSRTTTEAEGYLYDALYRLLNIVSQKPDAFIYDAVGNRQIGPGAKDTGYLHNAGNQMTQGRKLAYGYDNNGNQADKIVPNATDKSWTLGWEFENRLAKMEKRKGTESRIVSFSYDPQGRRIGKKVEQTKNGITKTESYSYIYDGDNIILEVLTIDTGAEKTYFTHGAGVDEHLALERSGGVYYYHADGLGSIMSITAVNRVVAQSYEYDSFGMMKDTTGFRNSYAYTGREWDKEAGLYYYRARYYDPMEGRFISKDPIGFEGGDMNLYGYVGNSPLNRTDPTGLKWVWFCKARLGSGGSARNTVAAVYPFFGHCYIKFGDDARGFYAGATEGNWAAMQEEERTPIINRWCRPSWVSDCVYGCLKKNTTVGTLGAPYGGSSLSNNCCTNLDTKVKECTEKCCGK